MLMPAWLYIIPYIPMVAWVCVISKYEFIATTITREKKTHI